MIILYIKDNNNNSICLLVQSATICDASTTDGTGSQISGLAACPARRMKVGTVTGRGEQQKSTVFNQQKKKRSSSQATQNAGVMFNHV